MGSGNGKVSPADFPPPVESPDEFIKRELDGEDDRIEIGVAIVGGGTAGLACANRLLQLLADDPQTLESLGEVPVAVVVPGPGFDRATVLRHFEGRLARFKQPRDLVLAQALPRNALGKVQLAALRALAAGP